MELKKKSCTASPQAILWTSSETTWWPVLLNSHWMNVILYCRGFIVAEVANKNSHWREACEQNDKGAIHKTPHALWMAWWAWKRHASYAMPFIVTSSRPKWEIIKHGPRGAAPPASQAPNEGVQFLQFSGSSQRTDTSLHVGLMF